MPLPDPKKFVCCDGNVVHTCDPPPPCGDRQQALRLADLTAVRRADVEPGAIKLIATTEAELVTELNLAHRHKHGKGTSKHYRVYKIDGTANEYVAYSHDQLAG
jgi:hypothetical protein